MEKSIQLLQSEITILRFLHNSIFETREEMKGRLSYETLSSMNKAMISLIDEIAKKEVEIEILQVV